MAKQEAGRPYPMSDEQWQAAQARVFGRTLPPGTPPNVPVPGSIPPLPQAGSMPPVSTGIPGNTMGVVKALSNPWLGSAGQAIGKSILEQQLKPKDQWVPFTTADGTAMQRNMGTGEIKPLGGDNKAIGSLNYALENWKKLNLPDPNSTDPKDQAKWAEFNMKALGGAGVNVQIDQSAPNEFEKKYGEKMGERAFSVIEAGDKAAVQTQKIALAQKMLADIQTGKISPALATVGAYMQAVGVDPKLVGINPNLPANAEGLTALTNDMVIGRIGAGGFPANNFSDADRGFLKDTVFSLRDRPEANAIKLEVARRLADFDAAKADAWAEARAQRPPVSYEKFEAEWRAKTRKTDLFADLYKPAEDAVKTAPATGATGATGAPVRVSTPEEARKLPSGTKIIRPHGSPRQVP
jgi:hypothetical protein